MDAALISIYTEWSIDHKPFKTRQQYNINWSEIIVISNNCGMIRTEERIIDNILLRITKWNNVDSYDKWLSNPIVQDYISMRDSYNREHGIINNLSFIHNANKNNTL